MAVRVKREGDVYTVFLDRPQVRNAVDREHAEALADTFRAFEESDAAVALRGRVVVLDFMDPRCVDICPLVSEEFLQAARLLGPKQENVVFLAVNVNQFHARLADVAAFSRLHHLDRLTQWHFLTGPTRSLRAVWRAYGVLVQPNPSGDVVHSSLLYFIDRRGREHWVASPDMDQPAVSRWAQDIATLTASLS